MSTTTHVDRPARRPVVALFGHDATELTLIKRARAFAQAGLEVQGFTFRRDKLNREYRPEWDDVDLGTTVDRHYGQRFAKLARALPVLARHRERLARADLFYARNLDMGALALAARALVRSRAPVVYEVLDVQRVFTGSGPRPAAFRAAERRVLNAADLLVVSSEAFTRHYFEPVQGYRGPWHLLENKIFGLDPSLTAGRPTPDRPRGPACPPDGPWVIAWLGNLRCPRTPALLIKIARVLGDKVRIQIHGYPTETGLAAFQARIAGHPNIVYHGEYKSPDDLQAIYDQAHFAWAFDYLDAGSNSDWLLPNRLYEGGFFGAPALAAGGTETGCRVKAQGLGWTVREPVDREVIELLQGLDRAAYLARRRALLRLPSSLFVDEGDTAALIRRVFADRGEVAFSPRPPVLANA